MRNDKNIVVIVSLAVFTCSVYANWSSWPTAQPKEERNDVSRIIAEHGEFLLLPYIDESGYNSKEAAIPDYDELTGIGKFAIIAVPESGNHEASLIGRPWLILHMCDSDLTIFRVSIFTPESFREACNLIDLRIREGFFSNSAVIPEVATPKLEGDNYSLTINTEAYAGVTRLSIERGVLIGVDYRSAMQLVWKPVNEEALLAQMHVLIDSLLAWIDGEIIMTDEKEEYHKNLKAAYKSAVSAPAMVEEVETGPNIWGDN